MITTDGSFVHAAELLATHLADNQLPQPAALSILTKEAGHSELTAQLRSTTLSGIATDLLVWVDSLTTVTVQAWRPPHGERVHLSITSTLTSPMNTVELTVFGATGYDPTLIADLEPGERRTVTLGTLRTCTTPTATTTDNPALDTHRGDR